MYPLTSLSPLQADQKGETGAVSLDLELLKPLRVEAVASDRIERSGAPDTPPGSSTHIAHTTLCSSICQPLASSLSGFSIQGLSWGLFLFKNPLHSRVWFENAAKGRSGALQMAAIANARMGPKTRKRQRQRQMQMQT